MVDMAREMDNTEVQSAPPVSYPYGLCISLTHEELKKLDLDADCEVGDLLHMVCMSKVTSISKSETPSGESIRVEMQIIDIETLENENTEFQPRRKIDPSKFYGN